MIWHQNYAPFGGLAGSAAVALVPILVLGSLLAAARVRASTAALCGLGLALLISCAAFGMPPVLAFAAAGYGALYGLFPIGWIVINAIFLYDLSVVTGEFAVLQRQVATLSADRRIQVLLIAFGFGAFIEGAAGFGAPVAITSALLVGLGFRPRDAGRLALIGNTAPVAFGSLGIPIITLAKITGLDLRALSATVGHQLPVFSFLIPFWLVAVQDGRRGLREVWPACAVMGGTFALLQFLVSNWHGPWLVDLASSTGATLALLAFLRRWQPTRAEKYIAETPLAATTLAVPAHPWRPWIPWMFLSVAVFTWSTGTVRTHLDGWFSPKFAIPALHLGVARVPPLTAEPVAEPAEFSFNILSAAGSALLVAGVAAGLVLGLRPRALVAIYLRTIWRLRWSLLTIAAMLALGFTTRYAGADATIGLALASTGILFPFFSPLIGWVGAALTGSDTSSNVLFGNVQVVAAHQLGLSPLVTAAANSSGGVMGKMIDAQSIVVATAAVGGATDESGRSMPGLILRSVFWHSLALGSLVGLYVFLETRLPAR